MANDTRITGASSDLTLSTFNNCILLEGERASLVTYR